MKTVDVLIGAKALIEKGWTKGANARTANGHGISSTNPNAVKFCLNGAILRASNGSSRAYEHSSKALNFALKSVPYVQKNTSIYSGYVEYNDKSKNKDRIVKLLDSAIEYVQKKSKKKITK